MEGNPGIGKIQFVSQKTITMYNFLNGWIYRLVNAFAKVYSATWIDDRI